MAINFIPSKKASLKAPLTVTASYNVWSDALNIKGAGRLVSLYVNAQAYSATFYRVYIDEILIDDSYVYQNALYILPGTKSVDFEDYQQYNASFSKSLRIEHFNDVFPVIGGSKIVYELE